MYRISNFLSKLIQHRKQLQPKPWRKCEKIVLHEIEVDNDFGWLKACPNKAKEYMKDENRYTDQYFKKDKGRLSGIKKFFNGLHSNVTDGVEATVERNGSYDYFYTYGEDKLPNLYRIKVNNNEDSAKELVIDQNHLSQETGYVSIGGVKISPCEKYVAFLTDVNLDGNYKCYVKEINPQASYLQIIDHVTSNGYLMMFYFSPQKISLQIEVIIYGEVLFIIQSHHRFCMRRMIKDIQSI